MIIIKHKETRMVRNNELEFSKCPECDVLLANSRLFCQSHRWRSSQPMMYNFLRSYRHVKNKFIFLYLLTQIRFPIGREHVTCHRSKLGRTKLPTERTTWIFDLHVIRPCTLKLRQFRVAAAVKQMLFSQFVLFLRGKNNSNTEGLRETNLTFSLDASH